MKYLCLSILLYIAIPFFSRVDWSHALKNTFIPTFQFNKEFFGVLIAILGTTISPYLFFWQATMGAEDKKQKKLIANKINLNDMHQDVTFGMFCSNLVMYFIILTTGTVLFSNGIHQINSVEQAAKALEPLAGSYSSLFFSLGILGTGLLSIPVLCGCLSYILSTTFGWEVGLNKKYYEAKSFYAVLIVSLILGLCLNFIKFNAMRALFYSAILYGIIAPVLILVILHISNNKKIMGKSTNGLFSNLFGFLTFFLMFFAIIGMIIMQI